MKSDIIIAGGGAAGLMAAVGAAQSLAESGNGGTVTVLEKMQKPGRKIMITGKGRCNFTNVKEWDDFSSHVRTDPRFVSPAFHNLTPEDLIAFFKEYGMRSIVERGERAFPASHLSGDVVDTLVRACTLLGVKIVTGCEIRSVETSRQGFKLDCTLTTIKEFRQRTDNPRQRPVSKTETTVEPVSYTCCRLIVATGGLSYPGTGSTGDGYKWAEAFGHGIEPVFPSLTALVPQGYKSAESPLAGEIRDAFRGRPAKKEHKINPLPADYPKLPGHIERITPLTEIGRMFESNKLDNIAVTLYVDGREVQREFGDLEFTDGGIEGPVGYMVSRKAVKAIIAGSKVSLSIDLKPAVEAEQLDADVHERWEAVKTDPRSRGAAFQKLFRILLGKLIPWDLVAPFLRMNPDVSINSLAAVLKDWSFPIEGFVGFERAVVTAGGISTDDVVAKTLESKKVPGLYFAGEVLDIDSDTGGYNLETSFATGYLAGQSAAKSLEQ